MGQLISLSIDLSKIDKSKIQTHDKNGQPFKNGGKFYNLTIGINDEINQYGQDVAAWDSQTQEERKNKEEKKYLGNGKVFFGKQSQNAEPPTAEPSGGHDDLPF